MLASILHKELDKINLELKKADKKEIKNMNFFHYTYENVLCEDLLIKQNPERFQELLCLSGLVVSHSSRSFRIQEKTFLPPWVGIKLLTGQSPTKTRAKKACANFKILARDLLGCQVTMNKSQIYSTLSKCYILILPRLRGFEGFYEKQINTKGFSFAVTNLLIFPELEEKASFFEKIQGINLSIQMNTQNKKQSALLLSGFQIPINFKY